VKTDAAGRPRRMNLLEPGQAAGTKNWLFVASDRGGRAAAVAFSIPCLTYVGREGAAQTPPMPYRLVKLAEAHW
jgi:hypothetical protein